MITYDKRNRHAVDVAPILPTVLDAEAALAAHQAQEVPHQHPCASKAAHKKRREWVEEKSRLTTLLDMALGAEANRWKPISAPLPGKPIPACGAS